MIAKEMMFIYGRIIIPFNYISIESRNSDVFARSDFKMVISFGNINQLCLECNSNNAVETLFLITRLIVVRFEATVDPEW